jgi:hypothetical protein
MLDICDDSDFHSISVTVLSIKPYFVAQQPFFATISTQYADGGPLVETHFATSFVHP